ncbi:MAG: hypothetical protein WCA32_12425 [Chromatiaceae bacterium]
MRDRGFFCWLDDPGPYDGDGIQGADVLLYDLTPPPRDGGAPGLGICVTDLEKLSPMAYDLEPGEAAELATWLISNLILSSATEDAREEVVERAHTVLSMIWDALPDEARTAEGAAGILRLALLKRTKGRRTWKTRD